MQMDKERPGSMQVPFGSKSTLPAVFKSPACSNALDDWSVGAATPALQVLPRHRQSAAAAAEAMLSNASPLSGLHKLALSICARKKGIPGAPVAPALPASAPGAGNDKENVSPPFQSQQARLGGKAIMHEYVCYS